MVAVLIANPNQETRTRELPPNPEFADFLNNELVPWVRQNYNVTDRSGEGRGGGFELRGNRLRVCGSAASGDVRKYPVSIRLVLVGCRQAGALHEPNFLAKEFVKSPKLPLRFYMDAGSFEVDMAGERWIHWTEPSHATCCWRRVMKLMTRKRGGDDYPSWRGCWPMACWRWWGYRSKVRARS